MGQVLVRDLDPEVIEHLKQRARRNNRSLQAELRAILEQAAGVNDSRVHAAVEDVRRFFAGRHFSDSAELIREDREG